MKTGRATPPHLGMIFYKCLHANFKVSISPSKKVLIKKSTLTFQQLYHFFKSVNVPANVYKIISKELCGNSTYIASSLSWKVLLIYAINPIGGQKDVIASVRSMYVACT